MTQFKAPRQALSSFFNGVTRLKDKNNFFFNSFFITVEPESIKVVATDSVYRIMKQRSILCVTEVGELGDPIPIRYPAEIMKVLSILKGDEVTFDYNSKTSTLTISDESIEIEIGMPNSGDELELSTSGNDEWDSAHTFDEEEGCMRITIPNVGTALYDHVYDDLDRDSLDTVAKIAKNIIQDPHIYVFIDESPSITFKTSKTTTRKKSTVRVESGTYKNKLNEVKSVEIKGLIHVITSLPKGRVDVNMRKDSKGAYFMWFKVTGDRVEYNFVIKSEMEE